ncbi:MAG: ABC transporter permease [Bacteroidales bacterium]|nr:ABC transporter permease [Bacteroidales bacterium]
MRMKGLKFVSPLFRENFKVALRAIASNRLRSVLTILIIAIGITSLVGIQTAIEALTNKVSESFGKMGAGSFSIASIYSDSQSGDHKRVLNRRNLSYEQVSQFVEQYKIPSIKCLYATALNNVAIKGDSKKTDPIMSVIASDENYINFNMSDINNGRDLNKKDIENAAFVCIIGNNIRKALFKDKDVLNKVVTIGAIRYQVVGTIKEVGSMFGGGIDNRVIIPITNARSSFLNEKSYYSVGIIPAANVSSQVAVDQATILFRSIRRLRPDDVSDFSIDKSDSMQEEFDKQKSSLSMAALIIGLITLLGAAVGLMNIMLVSVKERTREIGTRKTLGATSKIIKQQFLIEAIVIGQIGGLVGIIFGVIIGNIIAILTKANATIPWDWIILAVLICLVVSILSGYMPAKRAAALDPIDSLRYE